MEVKIPDKIRNVALKERRDLITRGLKLNEEAGELAAEILKLKGEKDWKGKSYEQVLDDLHLEAVDVMLMAMDILVITGATDERISYIVDMQLLKWESGIKDRK
jgi:NTP pyrophosphatase (non-canonical NTP hydrolase)